MKKIVLLFLLFVGCTSRVDGVDELVEIGETYPIIVEGNLNKELIDDEVLTPKKEVALVSEEARYYILDSLLEWEYFEDMEYLLFCYDPIGFYGHAREPWYAYALLGSPAQTWEYGRKLYEQINNSEVEQPISIRQSEMRNLEEHPEYTEEQIENYMRYWYKPHLVKISTDGRKHLYKQQIEFPFEYLYTIYDSSGALSTYTENAYDDGTCLSSNMTYLFQKLELENEVTIIAEEIDSGRSIPLIQVENGLVTSFFTDSSDEYGAVCVYNTELAEVYFYIVDLLTGEQIYESDIIMRDSYNMQFQHLSKELVVFSIEKDSVSDFYQINYKTGEFQYLFTAPYKSIMSPDCKYLAYTAYSANTYEQTGYYRFGYYLYHIESGGAVFIETLIDEEQDVPTASLRNRVIGWVSNTVETLQCYR